MRVAVFGTGGVGGYFGARLAAVGVDVVFIARGAHLEAIRTSGLRLESVRGDVLVHPAQASDAPMDVGRVDVVLLGVKTWQVAEAADAMRPLLGPETIVVPLQNGVETPTFLADHLGAEHVVGGQPFPLSLQAQCSRGQLHWPFVNLDAKIPPDVNVLLFS